MDEQPWAETEFGGAELHDPRRTARLVQPATTLAAHPCGSLPEALPARADLVGAYRFFANDCIDAEALLPSHARATQRRLTSLDAVIAAKRACPQTHFVSVGDREADVYDLFLVPRPLGVDLLVRAAWDRRVDQSQARLWPPVPLAPVARLEPGEHTPTLDTLVHLSRRLELEFLVDIRPAGHTGAPWVTPEAEQAGVIESLSVQDGGLVLIAAG